MVSQNLQNAKMMVYHRGHRGLLLKTFSVFSVPLW